MKITLPDQLGAGSYNRGQSYDNCSFGCALGELAFSIGGPIINGVMSFCQKFLKVSYSDMNAIMASNDRCNDPFQRALIFKKTLEELGHEVELVEMKI